MSHWFVQSAAAMVIFVPIWLAIGFTKRNYDVGPDVFAAWYFLGNACMALMIAPRVYEVLVPSAKVVGLLLIAGLIGGIANTLVYRAVAGAPNPGLPVAIASSASVCVYLLAVWCSRRWPAYFDQGELDLKKFIGVMLVVIGVSLVASK